MYDKNMIISDSAIGKVGFSFADNGALSQVVFVRGKSACQGDANTTTNLLVNYCTNARVDLSDITYEREGTAHQQAVWDYLLTIPQGQTRTYSEVSSAVGGSPRSVANALRRNPLPILFPCHRVVAKSGIGGFSGDTTGRMITVKTHLLAIEATHARR